MKKLRGTGVAMITPFAADGAVDYTALGNLVEFYINEGIDFLVVLGTTAETATLSVEEQVAIAAKVVAVNAGRLPLVLGKGGNNTQVLVHDLQTADLAGYCAILSVCPYYNRPNQEGIYQHFSAVAEASPLPVILYNVPARTGANIDNSTLIRLAASHKNIIGIKDATGNIAAGKALVKALPTDFMVLSGDDLTTLDLIAVGGCGAISVIAGAFAKEFSTMIRLGLQDKMNEAKAIEKMLNPFIELIFKEGNPTGLKALLSILGKCDKPLRLPLVNASLSLQQQIETQLKALTTEC